MKRTSAPRLEVALQIEIDVFYMPDLLATTLFIRELKAKEEHVLHKITIHQWLVFRMVHGFSHASTSFILIYFAYFILTL